MKYQYCPVNLRGIGLGSQCSAASFSGGDGHPTWIRRGGSALGDSGFRHSVRLVPRHRCPVCADHGLPAVAASASIRIVGSIAAAITGPRSLELPPSSFDVMPEFSVNWVLPRKLARYRGAVWRLKPRRQYHVAVGDHTDFLLGAGRGQQVARLDAWTSSWLAPDHQGPRAPVGRGRLRGTSSIPCHALDATTIDLCLSMFPRASRFPAPPWRR